ncbi:hypothetical protein RND81_13G088600 [Saponaria officinalis]|uniref:Bifunctional inhibitor/plant lipid transfer protein/seed storage helical domain-containing protein n=1 Tax=Saponaria officinalis TaxID=3572 RepID=A0AAW1GYA6_SAPOF
MRSLYIQTVAFVVVAVLVAELQPLFATNCDTNEIEKACMTAYMFPTEPSSSCCDKIRQRKSCYCGYMANPKYKKFITSSKGMKIAEECGVRKPKCY